MTMITSVSGGIIRRSEFLPFAPPDITEDEITAVVEVLRSNWITTGPATKKFESEFSEAVGAEESLAVNSCTGAMHIALATLGIGPGDEVITTPMTFCATANVIEHVGATVVLADISSDTLNINPTAVRQAITPKTKAILPVHFAGHPADMYPICEIARAHGLYVIEDAAHAMAAAYHGRPIGTIGDFTAFSFYATKNLTTAEGGMLTGSTELIAQARLMSLHGMNRDAWKRYSTEGNWYYEVVAPGFKYNMTDIQAAMGRVQLGRLSDMQDRRRHVFEQYQAAFGNLGEVETPTIRANIDHSYHLYSLRLNLDCLCINRAQFIEHLKSRNIGASVHFIPVHLHPFYRDKYGWSPEDFPVANREYQRLVSLPLHSRLSPDDVEDVIAAVIDILTLYRC